MYRSLDAEKIILTVKTLSKRIEERFPGSGLNRPFAKDLAEDLDS